jgi:hypothetical protein
MQTIRPTRQGRRRTRESTLPLSRSESVLPDRFPTLGDPLAYLVPAYRSKPHREIGYLLRLILVPRSQFVRENLVC